MCETGLYGRKKNPACPGGWTDGAGWAAPAKEGEQAGYTERHIRIAIRYVQPTYRMKIGATRGLALECGLDDKK